MKKLLAILFVLANLNVIAQTEDPVMTQRWNTPHTGSAYAGQWAKIAECTFTYSFQDCGAIFDFFGNGSGNWDYCYGRLSMRFKNQRQGTGVPTHYDLSLEASNFSADNFKAVVRDSNIAVYVRIPYTHTRIYFKRIIVDRSNIQPIHSDNTSDFVQSLDALGGDFIIDCKAAMRVKAGNIGIGTENPDAKLTVAGKVHAQEVKVTVNAGADFVFANNYKLPDLTELEKFVSEKKHLPGIQSEKAMQEEGLDLGQMNIRLLQKVEELTLYVIEQNKSLQQKDAEMVEQQQEMEELKARLAKLEQLIGQ